MSARALVLLLAIWVPLRATVKRVVIIKIDGLPEHVLERELGRIDPVTHRSTLPWIDHIFEQAGTRIDNFYVRAISLSTPSWSMLDTGQHLQIHGNVEFDRYTGHVYDYMNFFPFYVGYARSQKVDMPGVEVLDGLKIPLLIDRFPYPAVYQSFQLYQRGVRWTTLEHAIPQHFSKGVRDLLDEWTLGLDLQSSVGEQTERELIAKLSDPSVQYLDYFTGDFDHTAHATSDIAAQRRVLQRIDALIGRIWTAIQATPMASQTMLIAVSDHGMNTEPGIYSQGFNLVQFFNSRAGGAHHVVTNRHPMDEFKLRGLDPFISQVVTPSDDSLYLKGQSDNYPTAMLDLDGNERAAVSLRDSAFNTLQILIQQINRPNENSALRHAAIAAFIEVIAAHRAQWENTIDEMNEELGALRRAVDRQRALVESQPRKWTPQERDAGLDKAARRRNAQLESWRDEERTYSAYLRALSKLLSIEPNDFDRHELTQDVIPRRALGGFNSVYDLQNYVIGPSQGGLVLAADGSLDFAHSFEHVNYPPLLVSQTVRNNVEAALTAHPVDFIAMTIPKAAFSFAPDESPSEDPIWLYASEDKQALILSRGNQLRYIPICALQQDSVNGRVHFEPATLGPGFPLHIFEDPDFAVPSADRAAWLSAWHTDVEWLDAVHRTAYSDGIVALQEQFLPPLLAPHSDDADSALLARFNQRRRRLAESDFLIFANNHWNFNVRNFNPGGNHGSFLRASTHAILMFAGGADTGIPRHLEVDQPYDSLSFVPTILDLMGMSSEAAKLPGRPIEELLPTAAHTQ